MSVKDIKLNTLSYTIVNVEEEGQFREFLLRDGEKVDLNNRDERSIIEIMHKRLWELKRSKQK